MMGSGGMIVMDEDTCMVDVARYFMNFLTRGVVRQVHPLPGGLAQLHDILTESAAGERRRSISTVAGARRVVADASLCALGTTAPNPVLSTLRYFREEYAEHIQDKRCRAGVCKPLIRFRSMRKSAPAAACVCANARRKRSPARRRWPTTSLNRCASSAACAAMSANATPCWSSRRPWWTLN